MGLLDSMFGGGTDLQIQLDAKQVPEGGIVSGRIQLTGGKKPLQLTTLAVRLLYVSVQSRPDSAIPAIEMRTLTEITVAAGQVIPPGSQQVFPFQIQIPMGTQPTAHNVSYNVTAVADIPSVKDPSATAELVVSSNTGQGGLLGAIFGGPAALSADALFARWPAFRGGTGEDDLCNALNDFLCATYSEAAELMGAEPLLARMMREGSQRVRRAALEAWGNLVNGRVKPDHLRVLGDLAAIPHLDMDTLREVIKAAAKFADEGALPLVQQLAQHPEPEIRKEVADQLYFSAEDKLRGKRELLVALAQDGHAGVRASAFRAFSGFTSDSQIMHWVAQQIDRDPAPEVQAACIGALPYAHHHGQAELVLFTYEKHAQNPNENVRKEVAEHVHSLPQNPQRVWGIVQRLLADASVDVRRSMAWQFRNMEKFRELTPLLQHTVENDPSEDVRADGLGAMATMLQPRDVIGYYRNWLGRHPTEWVMQAVLDGAQRVIEDPEAKRLVSEMTGVQHPDVARRARDMLAS